MSLRTEIRRLARRLEELGPLDQYRELNDLALVRKIDHLIIVQTEARGLLLSLKDGRLARKLIESGADAATLGSVVFWSGAKASIPVFLTLDAATSGAFTSWAQPQW